MDRAGVSRPRGPEPEPRGTVPQSAESRETRGGPTGLGSGGVVRSQPKLATGTGAERGRPRVWTACLSRVLHTPRDAAKKRVLNGGGGGRARASPRGVEVGVGGWGELGGSDQNQGLRTARQA